MKNLITFAPSKADAELMQIIRMKILLIDHHALFREGLRHVLRHLPGGVDQMLEAGSFAEGLKLADLHSSLDLVLLELKAPGCDGGNSIKLLRQRYSRVPLVVLSGTEDCRAINDALSYGANGFVCKSSTGSMLLSALRLVLSGGIYAPLQPPDTTVGNRNIGDNRRSKSQRFGLTERQMHVLHYLTSGLSNKEIAREIKLSKGTVKVHIQSVYQALQVNNRMEAKLVAMQHGLVMH